MHSILAFNLLFHLISVTLAVSTADMDKNTSIYNIYGEEKGDLLLLIFSAMLFLYCTPSVFIAASNAFKHVEAKHTRHRVTC